MNALPTNFSYLYGEPEAKAQIRTLPEDFQVVEELGFEPEGQGEHVFLYIRKCGENTDWVARQLANFAQVSPRDVSYAGKKDRHAVTEQWFCVKFPIKRNLNWKLFGGDSIEVLKSVRHPRKLRLGALQGNRFKLRLRQVENMKALLARVANVAEGGCPNYFGEQRFGNDFGNLNKGIALLRGEIEERQRNKKGLYISAVRSWLFNQILSCRISEGIWDRLLNGDALMLAGTQSCFVEEVATDDLLARLRQGDIHLTGPMWGRGEMLPVAAAEQWERKQLSEWQTIGELLETLSLKQERRALRLKPANFKAKVINDSECWLEFSLPSGAFATSVLREVCQYGQPEKSD
ncbi:tRNA pseudouridine(13) synthase TruD [uncultured Neptuniibacter sp.]|uniref:tRNA pseudouridine(13) synthase TruD n=1 Tax=uncultured Neptuniibacter sp. TaxID=502143 RepID=UPI002621E786|nr:tRNA pseudouridine(13) synthase TruD [uncultured Neptuniibacter sp.]